MKGSVESDRPSADSEVGRHSGELITVLNRLMELHTLLAELIEAKIERMGRCDTSGMNECTSREQELVARIGEQESLRRVLTDRIGRSFGMSAAKARRLTASQLAEKLTPPRREMLLDVAGRLQALTTRIARRNRLVGRLSEEMLGHMNSILSAMTAPQAQAGAYSPGGKKLAEAPQRLFETVG